jgi:hypothetical protein
MLSGEDVEAVLVIFEWLPQQRTNAVADQSAVLQLLRAHGGALLLNAATCDRVQGE